MGWGYARTAVPTTVAPPAGKTWQSITGESTYSLGLTTDGRALGLERQRLGDLDGPGPRGGSRAGRHRPLEVGGRRCRGRDRCPRRRHPVAVGRSAARRGRSHDRDADRSRDHLGDRRRGLLQLRCALRLRGALDLELGTTSAAYRTSRRRSGRRARRRGARSRSEASTPQASRPTAPCGPGATEATTVCSRPGSVPTPGGPMSKRASTTPSHCALEPQHARPSRPRLGQRAIAILGVLRRSSRSARWGPPRRRPPRATRSCATTSRASTRTCSTGTRIRPGWRRGRRSCGAGRRGSRWRTRSRTARSSARA